MGSFLDKYKIKEEEEEPFSFLNKYKAQVGIGAKATGGISLPGITQPKPLIEGLPMSKPEDKPKTLLEQIGIKKPTTPEELKMGIETSLGTWEEQKKANPELQKTEDLAYEVLNMRGINSSHEHARIAYIYNLLTTTETEAGVPVEETIKDMQSNLQKYGNINPPKDWKKAFKEEGILKTALIGPSEKYGKAESILRGLKDIAFKKENPGLDFLSSFGWKGFMLLTGGQAMNTLLNTASKVKPVKLNAKELEGVFKRAYNAYDPETGKLTSAVSDNDYAVMKQWNGLIKTYKNDPVMRDMLEKIVEKTGGLTFPQRVNIFGGKLYAGLPADEIAKSWIATQQLTKEMMQSLDPVKVSQVTQVLLNTSPALASEFLKAVEKPEGITKVEVEIPKELEALAEEARKYGSAEEFGNNIPNYIPTKTGKLVENISDPSNWKDLTIRKLIDLKNNNPDFIVSAKLVSGGRGGVSRQKIAIKNLLLPDNLTDFYTQAAAGKAGAVTPTTEKPAGVEAPDIKDDYRLIDKWIKANTPKVSVSGHGGLKEVSEQIRKGDVPANVLEAMHRQFEKTKDQETGEMLWWNDTINDPTAYPRTGTLMDFYNAYENLDIITKAPVAEKAIGEPAKAEVKVEPTKPPIPPSPPTSEMAKEPIGDPIVKLNELIKQAKPLRGRLETEYTKERARRIAEVERAIDEIGGEKGYIIALSKLKGELAPSSKYAFEPIKDKLSKPDIDALYNRTFKHPYLDEWEKISAANELTNILAGEIPTPKGLVLLEEIYGTDLIKSILSKRALGLKIADVLIDIANIPRAILATADMSGFLRQGIVPVVSHPVIAAKAMGKTFQFAFNSKSFEQYFKDLPKDKLYPLMRKSGLAVTDPSRVLATGREEAFISRLLQQIPIFGEVIKFAERAYVGFLNKLRVDVFKTFADEFLSKGYSPIKDKDLFKATAEVVNTFTGRGSLGNLNRVTPFLNTMFFSPRLIMARFNALNPIWYVRQPKEIRIKALGDFAKFVAAGLTLLAIIKASGLGDVETDPRSSDFGKIKIGNTRWDIWGGFQQWCRVFSQFITGQRKNTATGEIISLTKEDYPFTTRKEIVLRFIEGKLAPVPALVNELISGAKTFEGEDITFETVAREKFIPMYIQDITEAYMDGGLGRAVGSGITAFFGVGVQTWQERKKTTTTSPYLTKYKKKYTTTTSSYLNKYKK